MTQKLRSMNLALVSALIISISGFVPQAQAVELQVAQSSQLSGLRFEDPPFKLPIERNFQMALLSVSSAIGRSCGKMEAYGWRMDQSEQDRVNKIFKSTVERLSAAGFTVTPENVKGQSNDITLFTADSPSKHYMFLWSAADRGLVLNLCETGQPIAPTHKPTMAAPSVETFPLPADPEPPVTMTLIKSKPGKGSNDKFSPIGKWIGGYTCDQGYTGGTLQINTMHGEDFKGTFTFYPTEKNRAAAGGSYEVYGQYDKGSKRILINPGKWLKHPKGYFNTVIVGIFDSAQDSFSGFFQGIKGCTSFEAHRNGAGARLAKKVAEPKTLGEIEKKKPKKVKKPKTEKAAPAMNVVPTQDTIAPPADGIVVTPNGKPASATATEPTPTAPTAPAPSAPEAAPKAAAPLPVTTGPASAPASAPTSAPAKAVGTSPVAGPTAPAATELPTPLGSDVPAAPAAAPVSPAPALQPAEQPAARVLPVGKIPPGTIPAFVPQPALEDTEKR